MMPGMFKPGSRRNSVGLASRWIDHGNSAMNGTKTPIAKRAMIPQAPARSRPASRTQVTIEAMTTKTTATNHTPGVAAAMTDINKAVPAARRMVPDRRDSRTKERIANGNTMAVIVVPTRPCSTAPLIAGSNA